MGRKINLDKYLHREMQAIKFAQLLEVGYKFGHELVSSQRKI